MRILIIGTAVGTQNPDGYYAQYASFFSDAATVAGKTPDVSHTLFEDLIISVGDQGFSIVNTREQAELYTYDLLILRGAGFRKAFDVIKTISVYAQLHHVPIVNDYHAFRDSSKLTQAVQFYTQHIPVAQTVYVTRAVLQAAELPIQFPCIMKATFGAHGKDNHVVSSIAEAAEISARDKEVAYVLQTFVPNDCDYRVLIVADELLVIERKAAQGTHLNNTSQGGSARLVEPSVLPEQAIVDARKMVKELNMTIAGVDILCHAETGAYYFLEVNSQPQLMSGAFVVEKKQLVARYLATLQG